MSEYNNELEKVNPSALHAWYEHFSVDQVGSICANCDLWLTRLVLISLSPDKVLSVICCRCCFFWLCDMQQHHSIKTMLKVISSGFLATPQTLHIVRPLLSTQQAQGHWKKSANRPSEYKLIGHNQSKSGQVSSRGGSEATNCFFHRLLLLECILSLLHACLSVSFYHAEHLLM